MRLLFSLFMVSLLACGCSRTTYAPESQTQATYEEKSAPSLDLAQLARTIHELVNKERAQRDLPALQWSDELADIARAHSRDMVSRDFFAHVNPDKQDPTDRGRQAGFSCEKSQGDYRTEGLGENIFYTYQYDSYETWSENGTERRRYNWKSPEALAREVVQGWMDSANHRENILNPRYDLQGLGVARTDQDRLYVTQNLC